MKKLFKLLLLVCFPLVFCNCSKDPETPKVSMGFIEQEPTFMFDDETVSVDFSGNVDHVGIIKGVVLKIGTNPNLTDAENYETQLVDASFFTRVSNLNPDTEYYYCYSIDYGVSADYIVQTKTIVTPSLPVIVPELPTVVTEEITSLGVKGNVVSDGGSHVTERGICFGKEPSPDISGDHVSSGEGVGSFVVALPNLEPGVYYVCAYATNSVGTAYGKKLLLVAKGGNK